MARGAALLLALLANAAVLLVCGARAKSLLLQLVRREEAAFSFNGSNKCDVVVILLGDTRLDDLSELENPVVVVASGNASRVAFLAKRRARCVLVVADEEAVLGIGEVVTSVLRAVARSELIVIADGNGALSETLRGSLLKLKSNAVVASRQSDESRHFRACAVLGK
jgi:hypothetical protein